MNIYYRNEKAVLSSKNITTGTYLENVYDPTFELTVMFDVNTATITGDYGLGAAAVDSLCIGYTNAHRYKLVSPAYPAGLIKDRITIHNFKKTLYINKFELTLEGTEPLYLGHLFLGMKTVLPRFETGPETGKTLFSDSSRSFGGQVFGVRRKTLNSFSANFPRIDSKERQTLLDYIEAVLNIEPHIIDPYYEAHDNFPPMYATLNTGEISMPKLKENGFYYSTSLSWQEAR